MRIGVPIGIYRESELVGESLGETVGINGGGRSQSAVEIEDGELHGAERSKGAKSVAGTGRLSL